MARGDEELIRTEQGNPNALIVPTAISFGVSSDVAVTGVDYPTVNTKLKINKPRNILTGGCAFKTPASNCTVEIGAPIKMEGVAGYMGSLTSTCLTGGLAQALQWTAALTIPAVVLACIGAFLGIRWYSNYRDQKRVALISTPANPAPTRPAP